MILSEPIIADDDLITYIGATNKTLDYALASKPECVMDVADFAEVIGEAGGALIFYISGGISIGVGTALIAAGVTIPKGIIKVAFGISEIAAATAMIGKMANSADGFINCLQSIVRDPVVFFADSYPVGHPYAPYAGKMVENPGYNDKVFSLRPTNDRKKASPASYSSTITVCNRGFNLFLPDAPVRSLTSDGACFGSQSYNKDLYNYYIDQDGSEHYPYLCPEEWRFVGADGSKRDKDNNLVPAFTSSRTDNEKQLENFKKSTYGLSCKSGKKGDTLIINRLKYKIVKAGTSICAILTGRDGAFDFSRQWKIGCHNADPPGTINPGNPHCPNAIPIREDSSTDSRGRPIAGTGIGAVVEYDNSPCYRCMISSSCVASSGVQSWAPIAMSSKVIQCLVDSVGGFLYGCDIGDTSYPGAISVAYSNFFPVLRIILALYIIAFCAKLMMGMQPPPSKHFLVSIAKVCFVIAFLFSSTKNGGPMALATQTAQGIATELQTVFMTSFSNGLCDYSKKSYDAEIITGKTTQIKNFDYLKPWDALDCRVLFYIGAPLVGQRLDQGSSSGDLGTDMFIGFLLNIPIFLVASLFTPVGWYLLLSALAMLLIAVFTFFVMIWAVQLAAISIVGFFVLIMLAPIFIPMCLFDPLKPFFDGWLKETVGFLFFQVIVIGFLSFYMITMDMVFFRDTMFIESSVMLGGKRTGYYLVRSGSSCSLDQNKIGNMPCGCDPTAFGCKLSTAMFVTQANDIFADGVTVIKNIDDFGLSFVIDALKVLLVSFLFYHMFSILPGFIGDLSGSSSMSRHSSKMVSTPGDKMKSASQKTYSAGEKAYAALISVRQADELRKRRQTEKKNYEDGDSNSSGGTPRGGGANR